MTPIRDSWTSEENPAGGLVPAVCPDASEPYAKGPSGFPEWQSADGQHRIILGDCLSILLALDPMSVDSLITDPPYCSGGATESARGSSTHQGLRSESIRSGRFSWFDADNMTTAGLCWLLRAVVVNSPVKATGSILAFCDWRMIPMLAPAMESGGWRYRSCVVWDKGHFGCGNGFRPQHEMIMHFTKRAPVFSSMSKGNVITVSRVGDDREHPTEKPVEVIEHLLEVVAPAGGLILDTFAGSCTVAVACARTGRRSISIEIEPKYFAVGVQRMERELSRHPLFEPQKPRQMELL